MVGNIVALINSSFKSVFDSFLVNKTCKNNIDYYHIITNKPFNLIISYEYNDKIWNLYVTYNKNNELEQVDYSEIKSLSGKKEFYKTQNEYIKNQVGFIKYIFNSTDANEYYLQFFAQYVKENMEDL